MKAKNLFLLTMVLLFGAVIKSSGQSWSLTGNSGTNITNNFIGTTDNMDLNFKSSNVQAGRLGFLVTSYGYNSGTGGFYNVFMGRNAGSNSTNTNNFYNVSIGEGSGTSNISGTGNTFIGAGSGSLNTTGYGNTFVGLSTGASNTTGYNNLALGYYALNKNTTGYNNISLDNSLESNVSGNNNIALGRWTLQKNLTGIYNIGIGGSSGQLSTGSHNIFIGEASANRLTSGDNNIFMGYYSAHFLTTGTDNLFIGKSSGYDMTSGNNNLFIGNSAGNGIATGNNNIYIGKGPSYGNATINGNIIMSSQDGFERFRIDNIGNMGIGTTTPNNKLELKSNLNNTSGLRFTNLLSTSTPVASNGRVLTVNATGDVVLTTDQGSGGSTLINAGTNVTITGTGVAGNPYVINASGSGTTTNTLTTSGNTITSTVNGVAATAPAVNTVVNSITGGQLTTTVNGVASTPLTLPTPATACNIYSCDGIIDTTTTGSLTPGLRTVTMGNNNLFFKTTGSNFTDGTAGSGRIYIGNTTLFPNLVSTPLGSESQYRLLVEGGILTEKVKVALRSTSNWADYVFGKDYKLMPIKEVENYINANKHLPNVPSSQELAKDGLDLGAMQAKQMEKIEELTLYTIEQQKQLDNQDKEIEILKAQMKALIEKNK